MEYTTYLSDRGIPLLHNTTMRRGADSVLTVENHSKWYSLFIVNADGSVTKVPHDGTISWTNHAPNPSDVLEYASMNSYEIDHLALEIITGRYLTDVVGIEADFVGVSVGDAPGNADLRKSVENHFCDARCTMRMDIGGKMHYPQNDHHSAEHFHDLADDMLEEYADGKKNVAA